MADENSGGRFDREVTNRLANLVSSGQIPVGGVVKIDHDGSQFTFRLRTDIVMPWTALETIDKEISEMKTKLAETGPLFFGP